MRNSILLPTICICLILIDEFCIAGTLSSTNYGTTDQKSVPIPPTELEVLETSFDYVLIIWSDNSDNETNFIIERHTEGENFTRHDTIEANATEYLDYRVDPGTHYYYRVMAINGEGISAYSNETDGSTLSLPHSPPQKPSGLEGYFDGHASVILSWEDNSDNELSFHIFRADNMNDYLLYDSVNTDITLFADYNLEVQHEYHYYLAAVNEYGISESSDTVSVAILDLPQPDSALLLIQYTTYNSIGLSWNRSTRADAGYDLFRITDDSLLLVSHNIPDTIYSDSTLVPGTPYCYQLIVNNGNGMLSYSNIVRANTLPAYTENRVADNLVALYLFSELTGDSIPDLSWYQYPTPLLIGDTLVINSENPNSLKIEGANLITSTVLSASKIINACRTTEELTVECWLKTSAQFIPLSANIVSLMSDSSTAFALSCKESELYGTGMKYNFNLATQTTNDYGDPALEVNTPLKSDVLQHLVFTHHENGDEQFYINGISESEGFKPSGFNNWDPSSKLVMVNNLNENSPWYGTLYICAIYNRALTTDEVRLNYLASPFKVPGLILNPTDCKLNLQPNPASDELWVQIQSQETDIDITESYHIRLIDLRGNTLLEEEVSDVISGDPFMIRLDNVPQGYYTMILFNQHNLITTARLLHLE